MKIQVGYNHTNARFIKMINLMNGDVLISFQKALITCTKCMWWKLVFIVFIFNKNTDRIKDNVMFTFNS
jgi:hypothetical protein